jgi:hypothetical protein
MLGDGPILQKVSLWRDAEKGLKSRISSGVGPSAADRDDISDLVVGTKIERGDRLQELRLKHYPTIDVDRDKVFAGRTDAEFSEVEDALRRLGFRNNPTAYVEVTEENGPDDGSYSKLLVTESGGRFTVPHLSPQPGVVRRVKDQIHVVLWETQDGIEFGAHREKHAWLQPIRHLVNSDADMRVGVRDFRDVWYDEFGDELGAKDEVRWDTTH